MAVPPVVRPGAPAVAQALGTGAVVGLPVVGGYCLAVRAGTPGGEGRVEALARQPAGGIGRPADDWPHYLVADADDVGALADDGGDALTTLLTRCWPGPLEVAVRRDGDLIAVGQPDGRALRRLCRDLGPWRTASLGPAAASDVAAAYRTADVACVVDGGTRGGAPPTVVDASVTPLRVVRQGALPASYIEAAMLMGSRRRRFGGRQKRP